MKRLLLFILIFASVECLNKFLKHFEPLNYQTKGLNRVSRSSDAQIRLKFHAYDHDFKLLLDKVHKKDSVFMKDATVDYWNETTKLEWESDTYKGVVEGDEDSFVMGSMHHGVFEGMIRLSDGEQYWVESSSPYNSTASFHSFIYSMDEIEMPKPTGRSARSSQFPGYSHFFSNNVFDNSSNHSEDAHSRRPRGSYQPPPYDVCNSANRGRSIGSSQQENADGMSQKTRFPRDTSKKVNGIWNNRICPVFVQIDYTLYEWMKARRGNNDHLMTRASLIDLMENQFRIVNEIFDRTNFGGIQKVRFKIAAIKIWREAKETSNPYAEETSSHKQFLDWNERLDHDQYCLAYVFAFRSFVEYVQGYAYTCSVCTKKSAFSEGGSMNTGLVTYQSSGNEIPRAQWPLTLAHEIAHNLGSLHDNVDPSPDCIEKDKSKGNYIMYVTANDGKKNNHFKFSPCTIRNITRHLKLLMALDPNEQTTSQPNCFVESDTPFCGNGIKEEGEECDCGIDEQDCADAGDTCCGPANSRLYPCKIQKGMGYDCSPSQGKCCDDKCQFKKRDDNCEVATDCTLASKCSGSSPVCPSRQPVNDNKLCDDVSGTCEDGECRGSVCATMGLQDCDSPLATCLLHCKIGGTCNSTVHLPHFSYANYSQKGRLGHSGIMRKPGELCKEGMGVCNIHDECVSIVRKVEAEVSAIHHLGEYLTKNWWILLFVGIIGVIIIAISIVICFYRVPRLSWRKASEYYDESTKKGESIQIEVKAETIRDVSIEEAKMNDGKATKPKSKDAKSKARTPTTPGVSSVTARWKGTCGVDTTKETTKETIRETSKDNSKETTRESKTID